MKSYMGYYQKHIWKFTSYQKPSLRILRILINSKGIKLFFWKILGGWKLAILFLICRTKGCFLRLTASSWNFFCLIFFLIIFVFLGHLNKEKQEDLRKCLITLWYHYFCPMDTNHDSKITLAELTKRIQDVRQFYLLLF